VIKWFPFLKPGLIQMDHQKWDAIIFIMFFWHYPSILELAIFSRRTRLYVKCLYSLLAKTNWEPKNHSYSILFCNDQFIFTPFLFTISSIFHQALTYNQMQQTEITRTHAGISWHPTFRWSTRMGLLHMCSQL